MQAVDRTPRSGSDGHNYPILAGAAFILVSLGLYWVRFPDARDEFVVLYVLTCVLALLMGSSSGRRAKLRPRAPAMIDLRWLWLACFFLCLTATVNISAYYHSIGEVMQFVLEPGAAYERVKFLNRNGQASPGLFGSTAGPVLSSLAFVKYVVFAWTAIYWSRLPMRLRVVCVGSMLYYALQSLLIGAMVNVGTVLISTVAVMLVKSGNDFSNRNAKVIRSSVIPVAFGLVGLSYFLGSRGTAVTGFWNRVESGADGLIYYVSHGYVGLGYALALPFEWTGGQTALYGFSRLFSGVLPPESYPVRTEASAGWSATQLWSTAVPWLASDLTFWGVPVLMLVFGYWAGKLWTECRAADDPYGLLVIGQITIGVFFFPANNHLMQTFPNASGFTIIVCLWAMNRRRMRRKYASGGNASVERQKTFNVASVERC